MSGGRKSKDKGNRFEWALRTVLNAIGPCRRMPLSGALGNDLSGDLRWTYNNIVWKCQCKIKANGYKTDYAELEDHDILFKRADRKPTLVVMTFDKFSKIIGSEDYEVIGDRPCDTEAA